MRRQAELWDETLEWVRKNPRIYGKFVELALEKSNRGEKFGIGALTERVRWDASIWFDDTDFKIPNAYRRYIAIHLMLNHPQIEAYCTTKQDGVEIPEVLLGRFRSTTKQDLKEDKVAALDIDKLLG
jgi:hypothetical protein